jgi:MinD superfamily P-loop ATPase
LKIIGVTGGKGGTGKSTFSVLYALKFIHEGKKVVLIDADVECPNNHLILDEELKKEKEILEPYPILDEEKCIKCGKCSEVCKENAAFFTKGNYPIFLKDLCTSCGACWTACPEKAIKLGEKKTGEIFSIKINDNFFLVTGLSDSKTEETGPIVRKTVEFGKELAKKENADFVLIDSAAGLHCPVISAIISCEKIFAVTEATPLGEHDVSLAIELIKKIGKPVSLVINKSDLGRKNIIYDICKKENIKVSFEIPYNKKIIDAYSNGTISSLEGII